MEADRFGAIFRQASVGIAQTDRSGRFLLANDRFCEVLGRSEAELLSLRIQDVTHPDDVEESDLGLRRLFDEGVGFSIEKRYLRADGSLAWAHVVVSPVRDAEGRPLHALAIVQDVTGRRAAEDALRESEERYRLLSRAVDDALWEWDLARGIVRWSETLRRAFGHMPDEASGPDERAFGWWLNRVHPDDRHRVEATFREALANDVPTWREEYRFRRADGTHALVHDRGLILRDSAARPVRVLGSLVDLTETRRRDEALRESENALARQGRVIKAMMDNATARLFMLDARGGCRLMNPAAEAVTGWRFDEVEGRRFHDLLHATRPDGARYPVEECPIMDVLRTRRPLRAHEDHFRRKDGILIPVVVSANPIVEDGALLGAVIEVRDVSEETRAREALEEARRLAAQSEKLSALGTLVGGVAHEIRTPLTAIQNHLQLIHLDVARAAKEGDLPPALAKLPGHVALAVDGVDRIGKLVRDLRRFTRMEAGVRRPASTTDAVMQAVDIFRATHRGRVAVKADLAPTTPTPIDAAQVQQVVINLLQNAADAAPRDGTIRVRETPHAIEIEIADKGIGIPPDVQARMFDAFVTTKPDGTGLGLSIVRRIVEMHGGGIHVESKVGEGTAITVRLPKDG